MRTLVRNNQCCLCLLFVLLKVSLHLYFSPLICKDYLFCAGLDPPVSFLLRQQACWNHSNSTNYTTQTGGTGVFGSGLDTILHTKDDTLDYIYIQCKQYHTKSFSFQMLLKTYQSNYMTMQYSNAKQLRIWICVVTFCVQVGRDTDVVSRQITGGICSICCRKQLNQLLQNLLQRL